MLMISIDHKYIEFEDSIMSLLFWMKNIRVILTSKLFGRYYLKPRPTTNCNESFYSIGLQSVRITYFAHLSSHFSVSESKGSRWAIKNSTHGIYIEDWKIFKNQKWSMTTFNKHHRLAYVALNLSRLAVNR